jgi:hypothetical protein
MVVLIMESGYFVLLIVTKYEKIYLFLTVGGAEFRGPLPDQ